MTTDIVKDRDAQIALLNSGAFFRSMLGRTRTHSFVKPAPRLTAPVSSETIHSENRNTQTETGGNFDLTPFDAAPFDAVQDGTQRLVANTIALLDYANRLIEAAEAHIATQEERINHLTNLSISDELTGLRNRRGFYEGFMAELDRCERGLSVGGLLVLIDLDNFKTINDTHGHPAGDACLRLVARTIADQIRAMDMAARLGGDEFVILLSNTSKGEATRRAQTLAWQLNNLALAWYGEEVPVRASLGLKSFGAGDSADKIFNEADLELYATKAYRGRKRAHDMTSDTAQTATPAPAALTQHELSKINEVNEG